MSLHRTCLREIDERFHGREWLRSNLAAVGWDHIQPVRFEPRDPRNPKLFPWIMQMTLKITTPKPKSNAPIWTPKMVSNNTGGAISEAFLKNDRIEADHNGTPPRIPFYRLGHRTIRYKPVDVFAYLEDQRVG